MGRAGIRPEELGRARRASVAEPGARARGHLREPLARPTTRVAARRRSRSPASRAAARDAPRRGRDSGHRPRSPTPRRSWRMPDAWFDAVRPGLALYGVAPSASRARGRPALVPAMTRRDARRRPCVAFPRARRSVTAGASSRARPTTVAVLPIGYHDGFRRGFSGRVSVLLRGKAAPVVGAVSMDVTLVDATESGAARGDRAVCLGSDGAASMTAWDLARAAGTIPYEILCGIGPRVRRVLPRRRAGLDRRFLECDRAGSPPPARGARPLLPDARADPSCGRRGRPTTSRRCSGRWSASASTRSRSCC